MSDKIFKNTMLLYFRMFLIMAVDLFLLRFLIDILGVEDYGIFNIVGGVVIAFSFLSNTMVSSTQRFFSFEIGKENKKGLKFLFSTTVIIYVVFAITIILLAEVFGVWFVNNKMMIPVERLEAANCVLQFTIFTFVINIMRTPYNSLLIAYEKMNIYAIIGFFEVIFKVFTIVFLSYLLYDKLILYSILLFVSTLVVYAFNSMYCVFKFEEAKFRLLWDSKKSKELLAYSGWNLIGSLANVLRNHGINLLLSVFFNPVVNAARAIAYQINVALLQFSNNFYLAAKPQITKLHASGDSKAMLKLVSRSAKLAYFLVLILAVPLIFQTEYILSLWLKDLPPNVILFTQLVVFNSLIEVVNLPLVSAIQATGKIKLYQITVSVILLLNLPVSYFYLKLGYSPEVTMYISIAISIFSLIPRLLICRRETGLDINGFFNDVIIKTITITILLFLAEISLSNLNISKNKSFVLTCLIDIVFGSVLIWSIGLTKNEKIILYKKTGINGNKINDC
jgi:O-antigen/teichoic acid export membrane protein